MAKNIDNLIKTINDYTRDIFNTFGGESGEYMNVLELINKYIPNEIIIKHSKGAFYTYAPDQPVKFSRSKASATAAESVLIDFENLRKAQREYGTAKKIVKSVYKNVSKENVKEFAEEEYNLRNNVNGWYETIENSDLDGATKDYYKDKFKDIHDEWYEDEFMNSLNDVIKPVVNAIKSGNKKELKRLTQPAETAKDINEYGITNNYGVEL